MMKGDAMQTQYDAVISAPFGAVAISIQDDFLVKVELLPQARPEQAATSPFVQQVVQQIGAYLNNPHVSLDIPIAVHGTPFQKRVWRAIAAIPSGETLTYGELADKVGSGPRAVANVCGANHVPLVIPCHRVLAKGGLGGFMRGNTEGLKVKQWLLDHEKNAQQHNSSLDSSVGATASARKERA